MSAKRIVVAVVDVGAGNLGSVRKALEACGAEARVARSRRGVREADALVLPGVGSFSCINRIGNLRDVIIECARVKPMLGICLGMQFLFEGSEEAEGKGFGIFKGRVQRMRGAGKLPQIGWNKIKKTKECELLAGISDESCFYFANSYAARPEDENVVAAVTSYGEEFPSVVARGDVFGVQFHPEKSGEAGLRLLKNFVEVADERWRDWGLQVFP
ncbi:MAG: imidazole glycerol phosphate synthase subunit HisH [Candidatus Micrarchaeota archaeon]